MPVFWGVEPEKLPPELLKKIDGYPEQIKSWVTKINEKKSEQVLAKIMKVHADWHEWRRTNDDKNYQAFIEKTEETIRKFQQLAVGMTEGTSLESAQKFILEAQLNLNQNTRNQYTEYQKKAIERSAQFVDYVLSNTVAKDSTLLKKFEEAEIEKIDPSLLSGHTRKLYDTAVNLMEEKLKDRNQADFLINLTNAQKWSLKEY